MNKKLWIAIVAVFVISAASLIAVMAYKGDPNVKGPNYNADIETQLEATIDSGNYDAWVQIRKDNNLPMQGRMFQVINKDNFGKFAEMHNAMLSGDTDKADSIRAELGLGQGRGSGRGSGIGQGINTGCRMNTGYSGADTVCGRAQTTSTGESCPMATSGSCPMRD